MTPPRSRATNSAVGCPNTWGLNLGCTGTRTFEVVALSNALSSATEQDSASVLLVDWWGRGGGCGGCEDNNPDGSTSLSDIVVHLILLMSLNDDCTEKYKAGCYHYDTCIARMFHINCWNIHYLPISWIRPHSTQNFNSLIHSSF